MARCIVVFLLFFSSLSVLRACDACSCSAGGGYFGTLPQFGKNYVGLRWGFEQYYSLHPQGISDNSSFIESKEFFNTVDLIARFYPIKKVQLYAFVPYRYVTRSFQEKQANYTGLSDASLLLNYHFWESDTLYSEVRHNVYAGGGVKIPTGRFRVSEDEQLINLPSLQPGSGSFDFIANINYSLRFKKIGINSSAVFKVNTPNRLDYVFGSRFNGVVKGFFWGTFKGIAILPQAGLAIDWLEKDARNGIYETNTGGYAFEAVTDFDVYVGRFAIGFGAQFPLNQNLSAGLTEKKIRLRSSLLFLF